MCIPGVDRENSPEAGRLIRGILGRRTEPTRVDPYNFVPTRLEPVAPPPPPDQINLMGVPQMMLQNIMNRQSRPQTAAGRRRQGKLGGRRMMTIPKSNY
jgi:hypothetical protein